MKKSKLEAAETRQRIVKAAAAEFRRKGIRSTGLSQIMARAGLTHGGFYRHFGSKDQLIAEVCAAATASRDGTSKLSSRKGAAKQGLAAILASYLSSDHRDNPAGGCMLAGLGSELARADHKTRAATTAAFLRSVDELAKGYRQIGPAAAHERALVVASAMIGALTVSRIVADPKLSKAILRNTKKHLSRI
jgi:TetR/AcrR family transcriptional regulator, transcriptional repressor for nem operon